MKRLEHSFVDKHLNDHFLIGINSLYWRNTENSSISIILGRYPNFSETFYLKYGNFDPPVYDIEIENIKKKKTPLCFLDKNVAWGNYVIDVISYFRMNNNSSSCDLLNKILFMFKKHFLRVQNISIKTTFFTNTQLSNRQIIITHQDFQKRQAKLDFDKGDEKPMILFQFKLMVDIYHGVSGSRLAYILGPKIYDVL